MNERIGKLVSAKSEYANTQAQIDNSLISLRTSTFCYITYVDEKLKVINCQPVVKESINTSTKPIYIKLPELVDVPYIDNGSAPKIGQYCVCIHLDRSIQELIKLRKQLLSEGKSAETVDDLVNTINSTGDKHALSNCIAFVNVFGKPENGSSTDVVTLTTNQIITGQKTFTQNVVINSQTPAVVLNTPLNYTYIGKATNKTDGTFIISNTGTMDIDNSTLAIDGTTNKLLWNGQEIITKLDYDSDNFLWVTKYTPLTESKKRLARKNSGTPATVKMSDTSTDADCSVESLEDPYLLDTTYIGSVLTDRWYNIINIRHLGGGETGDASQYGLQLRNSMTSSESGIQYRQQVAGIWDNWATIATTDTSQTITAEKTFTNKIYFGSQKQGVCDVDGSITTTGVITGSKVYGAVFNDYAEYRKCKTNIPAGYIVSESEECDYVGLCITKKNKSKLFVVSDTYGCIFGDKEQSIPVAVCGRALVYMDTFKLKVGDYVGCNGNGIGRVVSKLEALLHPERVVGTVSSIPTYKTWGSNNIVVSSRVWINVR